MTRKYTAEDFANARFAEHPDGQLATRGTGDPDYPWATAYRAFHDRDMARDGWVPVPTKPTITGREFMAAYNMFSNADGSDCYRGFLAHLGFEIAPDPEPTNTERLAELIGGGLDSNKEYAEGLAEYLNDCGVTAPNVKGN